MFKKIILFIFGLLFLLNFTNGFEWNLTGVKIISRDERLADKEYLFSDYKVYQDIIKNNEELNEDLHEHPEKYKKYLKNKKKRETRVDYLEKNRLSSLKLDKQIFYIDDRKLRWPISYKHDKTKLVIHHTASLNSKYPDEESVRKYVRSIYYYHAIKRAWGDIGYNFLIDQFGNIYEGRIGGEDVIGAHTLWNNVQTVGISLIGDFDKEEVSDAQFNSLVKLTTALAKKYNIDPYKKYFYHKEIDKYPYIEDVQNFAIIGHQDAGRTACPGKDLYKKLPTLRLYVKENLDNGISKNDNTLKKVNLPYKLSIGNNMTYNFPNDDLLFCETNFEGFDVNCLKNEMKLTWRQFDFIGKKTIFAKGKNNNYKITIKPLRMNDIRELMKEKAEEFLGNSVSKKSINKISYKVTKSEILKLIQTNVNVLLYEITNLPKYQITCTNSCNLKIDDNVYNNIDNIDISKNTSLIIQFQGKTIIGKEISIKDSNGDLVYFKNYERKSYAGIPWNNFHGEIIIKKDFFHILESGQKYNYVVINQLSFNDYLAGIAESNDQMPFEKSKVMALLAKTYMIFYLNKQNFHPSIPLNSTYNAVDDPRIFQKYVGAGREKTTTTWKKALNATKNKYLLYNGYVPILPYFSCSKGFTFSANQKFGWIDTPYLTNNIDISKCKDFSGHGVGLSGKGTEYLAKKGLKYKKILQWYYPGVEVVEIR